MLILVFSSFVPLIINYKIIFKNIFPFYFKIDHSFFKIFNKYIFLLFSVLTFKSFFLSSDIYLVSLYNDNNITGFYTSASILSKIVFYIPSVLINILFTESILSKLNAKSDQKKLFIFLAFNTILTIFLLFIFYYLGELFLSLSFGNQFVVANNYLFKLCIAMSFFSFITYFLYYMMGKNDYHVILPIIFSILIYIALIPIYNSPYQIIFSERYGVSDVFGTLKNIQNYIEYLVDNEKKITLFYYSNDGNLELINPIVALTNFLISGNHIRVYQFSFLNINLINLVSLYILFNYFICNKYISIITTLIFTFNPEFDLRLYKGHLNLYMYFIPVFTILLFEKIIEKYKKFNFLLLIFTLIFSMIYSQYFYFS